MKCKIIPTLACFFMGLAAIQAYAQEALPLKKIEFSWSQSPLQAYKGYELTECGLIPSIGSDQTFVSCDFYQPTPQHPNLQSCVNPDDYSAFLPGCGVGGLWVGLINKNGNGFAKEWVVKRETLLASLAEDGIGKFLGADAQGNLWVVYAGEDPYEQIIQKLVKIATNGKELVFKIVAVYDKEQIYSVVPLPNNEFMILTSHNLRKLKANGETAWSKDIADLSGDYILRNFQVREDVVGQDMPIGGWVGDGQPFMKYLGLRADGQTIMIGEGRLGAAGKEVEFLVCLSQDGIVQHTGLAPIGNKEFGQPDRSYYNVEENKNHIHLLPNGTTKLLRTVNDESNDHLFMVHDMNGNCQAVNPFRMPLEAHDIFRFGVYPLSQQNAFLILYSKTNFERKDFIPHLMKMDASNKVLWDQKLEIPENAQEKDSYPVDMTVNAAGKKALILFNTKADQPVIYEMMLK